MAWIKVPLAHHPIFRAALPRDPRVTVAPLFGGLVARVNGHIFAGIFARSAIVMLNDADRDEALALDGAGYFDPRGDGRMRSQKIMLPEDVMDDDDELRRWIAKAHAHAVALPPKPPKPVRAAPKRRRA